MRAILSLSAAGAALAALLAVPLPYYVAATFEVQPRDAASVYVDVPGELQAIERRSGRVAAGDLIARLENPDLLLSAEKLLAQRVDLVARIQGIRQRAHTDDAALLELSTLEEALAALDHQMRRLQQDLDKLTIRAPVDGVLVPPPSREPGEQDRTRLASWTGRPLDRQNLGAHLDASTPLCRIAQPGALEAILAIDQAELDFVRVGDSVDLLLAARPGERLTGQIAHLAEQNMDVAPTRLSARAGGQLDTRTSHSGQERPLAVVYQASVPLPGDARDTVIGATGLARIHAGYQPLWRRLWRGACRTFHFEM